MAIHDKNVQRFLRWQRMQRWNLLYSINDIFYYPPVGYARHLRDAYCEPCIDYKYDLPHVADGQLINWITRGEGIDVY